MLLAIVFSVATAAALPAQPRTTASSAAPAVTPGQAERSRAYYDFVLSRHLESEGDIDGAVAALKRAAAADPGSAEVRAELAGLHARQNQGEEAIAAAKEALAIDSGNAEAHWVLGTIYAALLQGHQEVGTTSDQGDLDRAILHLEQARPARRYDLGLVLTLGRLYLAKGDQDKAIEALDWVVAREPGITEAGYLLAQAYEAAGRADEAIATLRETVAAEPRFFRAWVLMGDLLEKRGDFEEAASAYGQAARQNPRPGELTLRQASALIAAETPAAAANLLAEYVKANPTDAGGLSLLSEAQRRNHDYDAAETTAKRLAALEPKGIRGPYALALVYEGRREYQKVVDVLAPVAASADVEPRVKSSRAFVGLLARLGYAYQELGDFLNAVATFEEARSLAPGDGVPDLYLAQTEIVAGRYDRAVEIARAGRAARPEDDRFVRIEAQALREAGRFDEAIALLTAELPKHQDDASMAIALATVFAAAGRWVEGHTVLDEAGKSFPEDLDVPFQQGALFEQAKKYADAERVFRAVLARDPLHAPTLNYLGYMLADRGEHLEEALQLITRALDVDPYNGSYLDSLGWAWFKKGDAQKARGYLERAAAQLPRNSVVQEHLGDVLKATGDLQAAITAWKRALDGDLDQVDGAALRRKIDDASHRR